MNKFIKATYISCLSEYHSGEIWLRNNLDSDEWGDFLNFFRILYCKGNK